MHCMLMDLLHGFEVLSTTEETLFNSRNAIVLCTNAFATEAYHFKANVLAVFISRVVTVPMFS